MLRFDVAKAEVATLTIRGTGCHGLHVTVSGCSGDDPPVPLLCNRIGAQAATSVEFEHEFLAGQLQPYDRLQVDPVVYGKAGAEYQLAVAMRNASDQSPTTLYSATGTLFPSRGGSDGPDTGFDAPLILISLQSRELDSLDALVDPSTDFSLGVVASVGVEKKPVSAGTKASPRQATATDQGSKHYPVWYGTNRTPDLRDARLVGYSAFRDTAVHYGCCIVRIPKSHKIGQTGSPLWKRIATLTDDRLTIDEILGFERESFWSSVAQQVRGAADGRRHVVVLIHGYNVSFAEAAIRAAQLGCDLSIDGAMAMYSWPSRGTLEGYFADEATVQASAQYITTFLEDIVHRADAEKVHVIAHSMGNRAALEAVRDIVGKAQERTGVPFSQFILAAPDVDAEYFLQFAKAYGRVAARTTMYVSDRDQAVKASRFLHGGVPRVGLAPPVQIVNGIDTVYVGKVDASLLGHGYVANAWQLLNDIHQLIHLDAEPRQRSWVGLSPSKDHWVLEGVV